MVVWLGRFRSLVRTDWLFGKDSLVEDLVAWIARFGCLVRTVWLYG